MLGTVVDIVTFGGCEGGLKVGDAITHEDVVPLDELADVAIVDALAVVVGQHFSEEVVQLLRRCFLIVELTGFQLGLLAEVLQHLPKGDVVAVGEHCDVAKTCDTVGSECRPALLGFA